MLVALRGKIHAAQKRGPKPGRSKACAASYEVVVTPFERTLLLALLDEKIREDETEAKLFRKEA